MNANSSNQSAKAPASKTEISAIIHNLRCGQSVAGVAAKSYLVSVENDLNILAEEHAALVAAVKALLRAEADMQHWGLMSVEDIKLRQKMCLENTIRPALAALAAVQKGAQ